LATRSLFVGARADLFAHLPNDSHVCFQVNQFGLGVIYRVILLVLMLVRNRDKQRQIHRWPTYWTRKASRQSPTADGVRCSAVGQTREALTLMHCWDCDLVGFVYSTYGVCCPSPSAGAAKKKTRPQYQPPPPSQQRGLRTRSARGLFAVGPRPARQSPCVLTAHAHAKSCAKNPVQKLWVPQSICRIRKLSHNLSDTICQQAAYRPKHALQSWVAASLVSRSVFLFVHIYIDLHLAPLLLNL
jgi:hypothetical protein